MILYGKPVAEEIRREYVENFSLPKRQRTLTVIADETSDQSYLKAIKSAAVEWDVNVQCAKTGAEAVLKDAIRAIDIRKNPIKLRGLFSMDGQSPDALYGIYKGETNSMTPCTPEAIVAMLDYYKIPIAWKNVVILGRSDRVGKPLALLMMARDATVTVCHSKTWMATIDDCVKRANIVVCAAGQKKLINRNSMVPGCTVVNVGGDYDETTGHNGINLIPFKGGVGCVTTAVLMRHVCM